MPIPIPFDQCADYQSNLDGRPLDVVCRGEESRGSLNFIQVYGDSPHTHMSHHYKHSVSSSGDNAVLEQCHQVWIWGQAQRV